MDPTTGHIYISRHVLFDESVFPFSTHTSPPEVSPTLDQLHSFFWTSPPGLVSSCSQSSCLDSQPQQESPTVSSSILPSSVIEPSPIQSNSLSSPIIQHSSSRPSLSHSMTTRSKSGISKPRHPLCLSATLSSPDLSTSEPATVGQTLESPLWFQAMNEEYQALQNQGT